MQPTPAANTQQVATQATLFNPQVTEQQQKIAERKAMAAPLVGKFCHIQISGIPVAHRLKLVDVTDEGLHFDNIKDIVPWEKVEEFKDGNDVPIPGDDKDKARVEKNHDLAALTLGGALSRIRSICEEAMAKKTPSIGKRDIAKLMETLDVAVQRLQEGGQTAEAVEVSWVKPSDNEALTSQFREAFNTAIESAINGLKASVQQAF